MFLNTSENQMIIWSYIRGEIMEEKNIRVMNEHGSITIPVSIQEEMSIKPSSLPKFIVKIEERPLKHIALYPVDSNVDTSPYLE